MALFGKKRETTETPAAAPVAKSASVSTPAVSLRDLSRVIIRPLITEKAAVLGERNVHAFVIHERATKRDVRDAIVASFKVTPVKVHIVVRRPKQKQSRMGGRKGVQGGLKKAYVYLKAGDRIDLV